MAQTLVDSQGREYLVQELLDQCRRNYHSTMLKKKPRLAIHNWSQADMQWIVENKPEVVQYRFGIDHQQAIYLQYRCRTRLRSKFI